MITTRTAEVLAEADALLAALAAQKTAPRAIPIRVRRGQGQLLRRAQAAHDMPPLPCGCHDPVFHLGRCRRARAA